jgi:rhodanese-related sulfurtransferase
LLSFFGLLNLKLVFVNPYYVNAAILGGIIMGAGFIMGGYCPGTSISALSIGKVDGLIFVIGGLFGAFLFAETYPLIQVIASDNYKGPMRIDEWMGVSTGVFTLLLILAAALLFWLAELAEIKFGQKDLTPTFEEGYTKGARIKYSVLLVGIGIIIAFLPFNPSESFRLKSTELLSKSDSEEISLSADQVAKMINNEDSTIQLIDLRGKDQFNACNIPGSINIPFPDLLNPIWEGTLQQKGVKILFYGNGDQTAGYAWTITTGLGYKNMFVLKGGLNEWFKTIMLSNFSGEKITPSENALFETRLNARKAFTQINSLPDSLKNRFFSAKRIRQSKLDGGCE